MADVAARGRKKKGEGPFSINFLDVDGKDYNRVPENVKNIQVADKAGVKKSFALTDLTPATVYQLAASELKRKLGSGINADFDEKSNNVISLAENIFAEVKSGKLFKRAESRPGAGRTFDADMWVNVVARMSKIMNESNPKNKVASKSEIASLKVKLEAADTATRDAWKKRNLGNPIFALAKKQLDAERAGEKAKTAAPTETGSAFDI